MLAGEIHNGTFITKRNYAFDKALPVYYKYVLKRGGDVPSCQR
jgi:hypothetical protein